MLRHPILAAPPSDAPTRYAGVLRNDLRQLDTVDHLVEWQGVLSAYAIEFYFCLGNFDHSDGVLNPCLLTSC